MKLVNPTQAERDRFDSDCREFRLAWKCADCVHANDSTGRCSLEYPNGELTDATSFDTPDGTYVFCKHFELI